MTNLPLFDTRAPKTAERFRAVDDTVMGGRSHSSMTHGDRSIVFAGDLSLANNGGFAQVRAPVSPAAMTGSAGVALRVRGDGRTYRLTVRQDGATYDAEFPTITSTWTEARIDWQQMRINLRGKRPLAPPPRPDLITALGFLLGDGIPGRFRLEVGAVSLVPATPSQAGNDSANPHGDAGNPPSTG